MLLVHVFLRGVSTIMTRILCCAQGTTSSSKREPHQSAIYVSLGPVVGDDCALV